ncbi:PH domain-like protein [Hypoxylon fuscum]|nr:PH domain-like protein [Hypoxylon fuscum]
MSQVTTPRKTRGHQSQFSQGSSSQSPRALMQQQHNQPQSQTHVPLHTRTRSQQLRVQHAAVHLTSPSLFLDPEDNSDDMVNYLAAHPGRLVAAFTSRTNTELNLSILRRYRPGISSILAIAANATVYVFDQANIKWDKSSLEGTLFVCAQDETSSHLSGGSGGSGNGSDAASNGMLFILNRKGLTNLSLDLDKVTEHELLNGLLIFKMDGDDEDGGSGADDEEPSGTVIPMENGEAVRPKVMGLWIYANDEQDKLTTATLIRELWLKVRARNRGLTPSAEDHSASSSETEDQGPPTPAMHNMLNTYSTHGAPGGGRRIGINELFAQRQNGNGNGNGNGGA